MPASEYQPQLATLVKSAPEGDEWLHEIKYDGYRIVFDLDPGEKVPWPRVVARAQATGRHGSS